MVKTYRNVAFECKDEKIMSAVQKMFMRRHGADVEMMVQCEEQDTRLEWSESTLSASQFIAFLLSNDVQRFIVERTTSYTQNIVTHTTTIKIEE